MILAMTNIGVQWILTITLLWSGASFGTSSFVDLSKVHEHMTDDELFSTFHVTNRSAVPDYEVVSVFHEQAHRTRRSLSHDRDDFYSVTLKNLELYLEPVDHVLIGEDTPVYTASGDRSRPHGIRYKRVQKPWPLNYTMLQDPTNKAALLASEDTDGKIYFEGTIGNDLVIKPVPSRFREVSEHTSSNKPSSSDHFLYKKKTYHFNLDEYSDWAKYFGYLSPRKPHHPETEDKVDIVYPEILAMVDHETYLSHNKNLQALCKYMAVFWNAVDLRFRALKETKVRLNIAGLIVPIDDDGAPYLTNYREAQHFLRSSETFDAAGRYLYKEQRLGKDMYDLTVVITNFNLCSTTRRGCDASTVGLARLGGACQHDEDEADVAVAVIEDHNCFDGVLTAAHEIAHLLGAVHDGDDSDFGPGATDCDGSDGFIMASSQQSSSNAFLWSECSKNQMRYFLRREAECLRNKPLIKKPIAKMLPGQLLSRDQQCRILDGMVECKEYDGDECGELYCRKPSGKYNFKCISRRPPAEGSSCSDGGMCLDGICVHEKEESNEVNEMAKSTVAPRRRELILDADD